MERFIVLPNPVKTFFLSYFEMMDHRIAGATTVKSIFLQQNNLSHLRIVPKNHFYD